MNFIFVIRDVQGSIFFLVTFVLMICVMVTFLLVTFVMRLFGEWCRNDLSEHHPFQTSSVEGNAYWLSLQACNE